MEQPSHWRKKKTTCICPFPTQPVAFGIGKYGLTHKLGWQSYWQQQVALVQADAAPRSTHCESLVPPTDISTIANGGGVPPFAKIMSVNTSIVYQHVE
jgi:hypothetical protein